MNIYTIRDNLKTTIAGKEKMLAEYRNARENNALAQTPDAAIYATVAFLEINLAELKRILQDVEQCEQFNHYEKWDGDE